MKNIITLIAVAFAFTFGACAAKQAHSHSCPATKKSCCAGDTCDAKPAKKK
jgi:hypothetical protein